MRILITGMNKNQCTRKFYLKQQLKVVPSHYSLYNCLVHMGHTVDQKVVEIGEDLSHYDKIIVYVAGPRQLVASNVYNGLWAISSRADVILAFDDWQVPDIFKGLSKCLDPKELFASFILGTNKKTLEELLPFESAFIKAIELILAKKNKMLISAFSVDHLNDNTLGSQLLFSSVAYPKENIFSFNPNPHHRNRGFMDFSDEGVDFNHEGIEDPHFVVPDISTKVQYNKPIKEFRFNFASLVQSKTTKWLKKQGFEASTEDDESGYIGSWPVDLYGSKAETQKRLTEDEMCKIFFRDWACLMPGYEHSGSGWWRARPLQCAVANCVLLGDPKEMQVYYGSDFEYLNITAKDLINMEEKDLQNIAAKQLQKILTYHPLNKSIQREEIRKVLE